jgi:hypothetical protein
MSSPLTSLSSLDDIGDDLHHDTGLSGDDEELKIAQVTLRHEDQAGSLN